MSIARVASFLTAAALKVLVSISSATGFQFMPTATTLSGSDRYLQPGDKSNDCRDSELVPAWSISNVSSGCREALAAAWSAIVLTTGAAQSFAIPEQKSYSTNSRNMARLSSGNKSAGSVYDNVPSSPAAAKRRAMLGCKVNSSRNMAAKDVGISGGFSEKDCNFKVMDRDSEFMLKALRKLDCSTCPYGIKGA